MARRFFLLASLLATACPRGPEIGDDCDTLTVTDLCAPAGLACTADYTDSSATGAFCELPGEYFPCQPALGCISADLECHGISDGGRLCLHTCATNADCWDPLTTCVDAGESSLCLVNSCSDLWQSCPASTSADGGDGTCVPIGFEPVPNNPGACLQGGTAAIGAACQYYRAPGAPLCAPGASCMTDLDGTNAGFCMALCNGWEVDAGPACDDNDICIIALPPAPIPDGSVPQPYIAQIDFFNQMGGCAAPCGLDGTGIPDAGCVTGEACFSPDITDAPVSVCLP